MYFSMCLLTTERKREVTTPENEWNLNFFQVENAGKLLLTPLLNGMVPSSSVMSGRWGKNCSLSTDFLSLRTAWSLAWRGKAQYRSGRPHRPIPHMRIKKHIMARYIHLPVSPHLYSFQPRNRSSQIWRWLPLIWQFQFLSQNIPLVPLLYCSWVRFLSSSSFVTI